MRTLAFHHDRFPACHPLLVEAVVLGTIVAAVAGCGAAAPAVTDPNQARAVLEGVLGEWRDGATPADLRQRNPPVHVADERWLGGARLQRFSCGSSEPFGAAVRIPVDLTLASARRPLRAWYVVTTVPAVSIVLAD